MFWTINNEFSFVLIWFFLIVFFNSFFCHRVNMVLNPKMNT